MNTKYVFLLHVKGLTHRLRPPVHPACWAGVKSSDYYEQLQSWLYFNLTKNAKMSKNVPIHQCNGENNSKHLPISFPTELFDFQNFTVAVHALLVRKKWSACIFWHRYSLQNTPNLYLYIYLFYHLHARKVIIAILCWLLEIFIRNFLLRFNRWRKFYRNESKTIKVFIDIDSLLDKNHELKIRILHKHRSIRCQNKMNVWW